MAARSVPLPAGGLPAQAPALPAQAAAFPRWRTIVVVMIGAFMVMLDQTIVNIALDKIINVFEAPVTTVQLVLTVYMLSIAIVIPATGYVSDLLGAKRVYLTCLALFTLGSLLCGLAWSVHSLVVFRAVQGLGGGMLGPLGMAIVFRIIAPEERGRLFGLFALPMMVAPVLGPTLGGYLVEYVDWRLIFFINIPIGLVGVLFGIVSMPETPIVRGKHFDLPGFLLCGAAFGALLYGLSVAPTDGWGAPHVVTLLVSGTVLLIAWLVVELVVPEPLLILRVFKNIEFTLAMTVNFIITIGLFSSMFLLPIFLQSFRGLGAMETGVLLLPQAIASALMAPISGIIYDRIGPRPPIVVGLSVLVVATYFCGFLSPETSSQTIALLLVARGFGMGLALMPTMTLAMSCFPTAIAAQVSSLQNVLRQLVAAMGTAMFATLLSSRQSFHAAMLGQLVTPDLVGVRTLMGTVTQYVAAQGMSVAAAKGTVVMLLYQQVMTKAAVQAFDDCFLVSAAIGLITIVPALLLRKPDPALARGSPPERAPEIG